MPIMAIPSACPTTPTSSPLKPRYVSPQNRTLNHGRRVSGARRMSTSTTIPLFPNAESPRTLCPRDPVAFAYDPSYLREWDMPQDLWEKLPECFQHTIASVQHAGAAVLTGLDRLEEANRAAVQEEKDDDGDMDSSIIDYHLNDGEKDAHRPPRFPPSSAMDKSPTTGGPVRHDSGFFSCSPISSATTPSLSSSQSSPQISPLELPSTPTSSHTFTTPSSPAASYYLAELSHLRSEALPRLRHNALRVEADFQELRRLVAQLRKQGEVVRDAECLEGFEAWWKEKKDYVAELEKKVKEQAKGKPSFGNWVLSPVKA